jgi:hypothetical protein
VVVVVVVVACGEHIVGLLEGTGNDDEAEMLPVLRECETQKKHSQAKHGRAHSPEEVGDRAPPLRCSLLLKTLGSELVGEGMLRRICGTKGA